MYPVEEEGKVVAVSLAADAEVSRQLSPTNSRITQYVQLW